MSPVKAKVIVVDCAIHGEINQTLNEAGHIPLWNADNLADALIELDEFKEEPDIALIGPIPLNKKDRDTYLDEGFSEEFARALNKRFPNTRTVFLGGRGNKWNGRFCDDQFNVGNIEKNLAQYITSLPPRARR